MKWSKKEKEIARELFSLALKRDYERLIKDIRRITPKKPEDVWRLKDFLNNKAKEFDRVYRYRYSDLLETFAEFVSKGLLGIEELQRLDKEKVDFVSNILKIYNNNNSEQIYRLKIALDDTKPTVYRTIDIQKSMTFYDLHRVIQILFGWSNSHLHEFRGKGFVVSDLTFYDEIYIPDEIKMLDEFEIKISDILKSTKDKIKYLYDFGDSWEITITLERVLDAKNDMNYPVCIRGKRNSPPEDIGGVWGFENFKEIMADPNHTEHEDYKEWYGGEYDPDFIDLDEINNRLLLKLYNTNQ